MYQLEIGTVETIDRPRAGLARLRVVLEGTKPEAAFALEPIASGLQAGDEVLLHTTAERLGLGSSEGHVVVANLTRPETRGRIAGSEMKARYTASQVAVELAESPTLWIDADLGGIPVVVAELHSALVPIVCGIRATGSQAPVAYVMPDWNGLPVALSDAAHRLRELGWLSSIVTCGQAYGGDLEAASLPAGLCLAADTGAEGIVVVGGPGHLGGPQPFGFSAAGQADALHLAAALRGEPILAPRVSGADERERHRGVSHHTRAILERLLLTSVALPIPHDAPPEIGRALEASAARTGSPVARSRVPDYVPLARESGLKLETMGRGVDDDPLYFRCLAAAAAHAASLMEEDRNER
jgi:hypothetical protein